MARAFRLEWEAHEYEHKERSQDWFWAVGIITFAVAITAVILGNPIFAILVIVGAFSLALFINRPPETVRVAVDEKGVTRGKVRYPYATLDSYWIDLEHPHPKIILKSKKLLMPLIIVPLGSEADAEELDERLSEYLSREFHTLPLVEQVLEYLGF